jgi:glycosyltransferase involved in cell wall biosynthesis
MMPKVVHIQYSTEAAGGAALRLQQAFINAGIQSQIISLQKDLPPVQNVIYLGKKERAIARINTRIQNWRNKKIPAQYGLFSHSVLSNNILNNNAVAEADIIYIHWVLNGFLSIKNFQQLVQLNKPVIFFMHDMWGITGGCHYSFDCENYKTGCNNCQMFPDRQRHHLLPAKNYRKKMKLYDGANNFYFVSPSRWLYNTARQSLLTKNKPLFYIPNVLDAKVFKPYNKTVARQLLNLNENEIIIAFGAVSVTSPYKGWPYLVEALKLLKQQDTSDNISVLIFGSGYSKTVDDAIPFKKKFMGYLSDEYSTALVYNAADVFIAPSLAEAFGFVIMESLSCGTPVVGFNTGGIRDMIDHKKNGYLAEYKNTNDIVTGIKYCIENKLEGYMLPEFDQASSIEKHKHLFNFIDNQKQKLG